MRLIDAGLILDNLSGHLESMKDYDAVKDVINNMPTAYEPDKVVEQLKDLRKAEQDRTDACDDDGCGDGEQIYDDGRSQGRFEAYVRAIEIVKGGGVDGN